MDVSPTDMIVGKTPVPPDGYEIVRVDVVVRLRRKGSKAAPLRDEVASIASTSVESSPGAFELFTRFDTASAAGLSLLFRLIQPFLFSA